VYNWNSVTYGNGLFVAVEYDGQGQLMTSTDGATWTARVAPAAGNSVTYGNGVFVAVAYSGTNRVMTSSLVESSTTPSAPTSLVATPGVGSASIAFTAGANGGASITKYQYSTNGGTSWSDAAAGTTSPVSITGLTNYTTYNISLRAVNSAGGGAASSTVSVTPAIAGPTSCSAIALGRRSIQACWDPFTPSLGTLFGARARVFLAGTDTQVRACVVQGTATGCSVGALKFNTAYEVRVLARIRVAPHRLFWTLYGPTQQVTTLP
jgi:hypothetical protein